jgi:hypothetical protein
MGIGPFELGVSGLIVGGVVAVLVAAAAVTILVLLMWAVALTVVTPAMGGAAAEARHSQQRAWLKQVRQSWRAAPPEDVDTEQVEPPPPHRREVRGVGVVGTQDAGAHTQLLAAQVAPTGSTHGRLDPMAIMRVTLKPDHQLVLPPHPHCNIAVYVLAGRGAVGSHGQRVRGGEVALHGRRAGIRVGAVPADECARPMELLVVPQWPDGPARLDEEPLVRPIGADVRHQLRVLQILAEDLPTPVEAFVPAQATAVEEVPERTADEAPVHAPAEPLPPAVPAA